MSSIILKRAPAQLELLTVGRDCDLLADTTEAPPPRPTLAMLERCALVDWMLRYLQAAVAGVQSPNTLAAKARDLAAFAEWHADNHGATPIESWRPRDTQAFLDELGGLGRAPTTINRIFATLRHFARWVHAQPGGVFASTGLPTQGIKELAADESDCKKLTPEEISALFEAADHLVATATRANAQPRRNRAILALMRYTGLRVSEVVALKRNQLQGNRLVNVARKGKARSKVVYLVADCRRYIDDCLATEVHRNVAIEQNTPLFVSARGGFLTRQTVNAVLDAIAATAKLEVHPHQLRHAFGWEFREKTGSDSETAVALGHTSMKHVGRYTRPSQSERETTMEAIFG